MEKVRGYKVFNSDWTCRGFRYEVGKTYHHEGPIELCQAGFHFCEKLIDCFNYYFFELENKVAEVIATGEVIKGGEGKCVTNRIEIVREISWNDVWDLVNMGNGNSGIGNTGDRNIGSRNSGNMNSGNYNTGSGNTGDYNSGNFNSGDCNTGQYNIGKYNAGNQNSGNYNTGSGNTGDMNSGNFNSGGL